MDWQLQQQFINSLVSRTMDVQLMYRTRDKSGMIFHVTGEGIGEFIKLEARFPNRNTTLFQGVIENKRQRMFPVIKLIMI
jgi:hypothetical protein